LKKAIETLYTSGKVVASVCHGPVCFVDCIKADGTPLVSGLKVTGFSNTEEEAVQLTGLVPFLLEDKLKELGGNYEKGDDWNSKICVDGNLVTGQNPQSSDACADAVIAILK
jgi:putative intracellular protease/amidase